MIDVSANDLLVQRIANCDIFVGTGIPTSWGRLYGGQTLAQSVMAASSTVPDEHMIHSLHAYFILAGDSNKQILFDVDRIRDGKAFKTRSVKALQDSKTIFQLTASFHVAEEGAVYQKAFSRIASGKFAELPDPDDMTEENEHSSETIQRITIYKGRDWNLEYVRFKSPLEGWKLNCSMLAFLSDQVLVSTVKQPHVDQTWSMYLSLDHSIHFHRPDKVKVSEWMIFYSTTLTSSGSRGTASTLVFNHTGDLLATFHQEALIRIPQPSPSKL